MQSLVELSNVGNVTFFAEIDLSKLFSTLGISLLRVFITTYGNLHYSAETQVGSHAIRDLASTSIMVCQDRAKLSRII